MHTEQPIPIPTAADMAENIRAVHAILRRRGWRFTQPTIPPETLETWSRALAAKRTWDSPETLADYLAAQSFYWTGHQPTPEERAEIDAKARTIWADAESERVVPS